MERKAVLAVVLAVLFLTFALALGCSAKGKGDQTTSGPTGEEFKGKLTGGAPGQKGVGTGGMAPFSKKGGAGAGETTPAEKSG